MLEPLRYEPQRHAHFGRTRVHPPVHPYAFLTASQASPLNLGARAVGSLSPRGSQSPSRSGTAFRCTAESRGYRFDLGHRVAGRVGDLGRGSARKPTNTSHSVTSRLGIPRLRPDVRSPRHRVAGSHRAAPAASLISRYASRRQPTHSVRAKRAGQSARGYSAQPACHTGHSIYTIVVCFSKI